MFEFTEISFNFFSAVNIPANTRVLISSCSIPANFVYGLISIPPTSALIFGDAVIALSATGMRVNGALLMGSPTCRLRNKITVTIYGSVCLPLPPFSYPSVAGAFLLVPY